MNLVITTKVEQHYKAVKAGINEQLFKQLAPPFPPFRLLRFDGSKTGDYVHIELNLLLCKQLWISRITDHDTTPEEYYFVDEGEKLPFFLKTWKHRHRFCKYGEQTYIIDDISYTTPFLLLDYLMYPAMWLQFAYRRPIYKRVFKREP